MCVNTDEEEPTLADYVAGVDATSHAVNEVRAEWIKKTIKQYEKLGVLVLMFIQKQDLNAHGVTDYKSFDVRLKAIVVFVNSRRFFDWSWDNPFINDDVLHRCYKKVKLHWQLASFGL